MQSKSGIPIPWLRRVAEFSRVDSIEETTKDTNWANRREAIAAADTLERIRARWKTEPMWIIVKVVK